MKLSSSSSAILIAAAAAAAAAGIATVSAATILPPSSLEKRLTCTLPTEQSCLALFSDCASATKSVLAKPWQTKSCVLAAICSGQSPDAFLSSLACQISTGATASVDVKSVALPRLTKSDLATNSAQVSAQNFIDSYYSTLSAIGSKNWPTSPAVVTAYLDRVLAWSGYCGNGKSIPVANLADWFQYSSTVSGPATTCAGGNSDSCPQPAESSCAFLYQACLGCADSKNPLDTTSCVMAATCFKTSSAFISSFNCATKSSSSFPRVSTDSFADISNGNDNGITQQDYIDAYYGQLAGAGATTWPAASVVIGYYNNLVGWTKTNPVPARNLADYVQYNA